MAIRLVMEIKVSGILNMGKRSFNNIMWTIWEMTGRKWHGEYRPKHFTTAGAREYGYGERSRGYQIRKAKGYVAREKKGAAGRLVSGHQRPLFYTGISEEMSRRLSMRTTSLGVVVKVPAPRLNWRPRGGTINLAAEMTKLSEDEAREIRTFVGGTLIRAMESHPEAKITVGDGSGFTMSRL